MIGYPYHRNGARYYACWLGRWTASDPAGMVDGVNLYMYVRGNPVNGADSNGKWTDQDLLTKPGQNSMMQADATSVNIPRAKSKISSISGSSSLSSSSSSASSATNSKSSSTATPSKPASKPEWRQREPGFRDRLDKEGGPISFLFKIGYDIADEIFLSGQRAKNTILRSDNDEFRLNGDFATNTEVQDALVNMMLLGIPEAKGLTSIGKAVEKGVGAEAKGISEFSLRQEKMLMDDIGYNITPMSDIQMYEQIGRNGTFITDRQAMQEALGTFEPGKTFLNAEQSLKAEQSLGLLPNRLNGDVMILEVKGISGMSPRSPLIGNEFFLGAGKGLPNNGPELIINPILTRTLK